MVANQMQIEVFKRIRKNFAECKELFPDYATKTISVLEVCNEISMFIVETCDDLTEQEHSELDELLRDSKICASRIKYLANTLKKCAQSWNIIENEIAHKKKFSPEDLIKVNQWLEIFMIWLDAKYDFAKAFNKAIKKRESIENKILSKRDHD